VGEKIRGKTGAANRRWQQRIEERKQPDLQTRAEKKKSGSSGQFKTQTHLNQARTRNRSSNKIWQQNLTGKKTPTLRGNSRERKPCAWACEPKKNSNGTCGQDPAKKSKSIAETEVQDDSRTKSGTHMSR
jgi:hypothetical protein